MLTTATTKEVFTPVGSYTVTANAGVAVGTIGVDSNNNRSSSIIEPRENDVLSGRGARGRTHVGTQAYRTLVQRNQARYSICPEREKRMISKSIVDTIVGDGRRFLGQKKGISGWYVMSLDEAIKKTSQALREGQPKRRQELVRSGVTKTGTNTFVPTIPTPLPARLKSPENTSSSSRTFSAPTPPAGPTPPYVHVQTPQQHSISPSITLPNNFNNYDPITNTMFSRQVDHTLFNFSEGTDTVNKTTVPEESTNEHSFCANDQDIILSSRTISSHPDVDIDIDVDIFNKVLTPVDTTESRISGEILFDPSTDTVAMTNTSSSTAAIFNTMYQTLSDRGLLLYAEQQKSLHGLSTNDGGVDISDISLFQPFITNSIRSCMTSTKSMPLDVDLTRNPLFNDGPNFNSAIPYERHHNYDFPLDNAEGREALTKGLGIENDSVDILAAYFAPTFQTSLIESSKLLKTRTASPSENMVSDHVFDKKVEEIMGSKRNQNEFDVFDGQRINHSLNDMTVAGNDASAHSRVITAIDQSLMSCTSQLSTLSVGQGKDGQRHEFQFPTCFVPPPPAREEDPPVSEMRQTFALMKRNRTPNGNAPATGPTDTTMRDDGRNNGTFSTQPIEAPTGPAEYNVSILSDNSFVSLYSQALMSQDFRFLKDPNNIFAVDEDYTNNSSDVEDDEPVPQRGDLGRSYATRSFTDM
jgi:hypothetical protein